MGNWYTNRSTLKSALSIPATTTRDHVLLDIMLEGVSREIDAYCGMQFYPSSGVRYYRPQQSTYLDLDYPLLNIDGIALDTNADSAYESTLDSTSYYTLPYNATEQSPPDPSWAIELRTRTNASAVFPTGVARGVRITGTWGYYDQRKAATNVPATAIDATQKSVTITGSTNIHPGQTIRLGAEQMFVEERSTGTLTVKRAVNGTTGATHSSNSTMSVYEYPIVDRACLFQSEMDFRGKDAPLGIAAGDNGGQIMRAGTGLHPFTRRLLDNLFRVPTVA